MLFSVIIPVYNTKPNNLRQCIESVLNQTQKSIELILVDDGSSENDCLLICNEYSCVDNRIKLISCKENLGPGAARNRGLELASGENISFIDSDDWIESDTYEVITQFIIDNKIDTVIFDYNRVYGEKVEKIERGLDVNFEYSYHDKNMWKYLVTTSELNGPCYIIYSKKIIDKYKLRFPQNMRSGEDLFFNIEYFKHSHHGKHIPKAFYNYRFNKESITNVFCATKFDEYHNIYLCKKQILHEFLMKSKLDEKYECLLDDEYTKELFRLTCQALHAKYNIGELYSILELDYIQKLTQAKTKTLKIKLLKFLLDKKCFTTIKTIYEMKLKLSKQ